jgi:hypothetical protein
MGPCHHGVACPDLAVGETPQMSRFAANILNNQSR